MNGDTLAILIYVSLRLKFRCGNSDLEVPDCQETQPLRNDFKDLLNNTLKRIEDKLEAGVIEGLFDWEGYAGIYSRLAAFLK